MSQNINVTIGLTEQTVVFEGSSDADALAFAQSIGRAITAEPASVSGAETQVITTGGTSFLPSTSNAVVIETDAPTTVVGTSAAESVLGGGGNVQFFGGSGSTINVALGAGADTIGTGTGTQFDIHIAGGGNTVFLGGGANGTVQVGAGSGNTIFAGSGSAFISSSGTGDVIALASGAATVNEGGRDAVIFGGSGPAVINDAGTNDTITGGTGAETIFGGSGSTVFLSTSSSLVLASTNAGGADTIVGEGSGSSTIFGGTRDLVFTNQSSILYVAAASGTGTIDGASGSKSTIFGAAGANVDYIGSAENSTALLVAGAGSETLTDFGSAPVTFIAGSGNDLIGLGIGPDSVEFAKGTTGNVTDMVTGFSNGDDLLLSGYNNSAADVVAAKQVANGNTTLTLSDGTKIVLAGYTGGLQAVDEGQEGAITAVCYVSGTRIRTVHGDVSVEDLRIGDLAVTASGESRPISWISHRAIDCRRHPRPGEIMPIRIAAHTFNDNRPARDLFVSPGHSICVDVLGEVLIPAIALVNGSTIQQVEVDEVTYWHVELDSHDIILAENLPAESFLDMGNRGFFQEANVVNLAAGPDANPAFRTHADFCRPFIDGGPILEAVKSQLHRRAENIGWVRSDALELHLVVDGRHLDPVVRGLTARFQVPAGAKAVWLVSPTARPCDTMGVNDSRDLGLYIAALSITDGFGTRDVAIDDPLLCIGFHEVEEGSRRWTSERARLPAALWDECGDDFFLRIDLAGPPVPRWQHTNQELWARAMAS